MNEESLMMPFERKASLFQKAKNIPKQMGILFMVYTSFPSVLVFGRESRK